MVIKKTTYRYNIDGFDYKEVAYRNNNDDPALAVYVRVTGTTDEYQPFFDGVVGEYINT